MQANVGRIMGSRWYSGVDITGNSTTPTSYDTDIDYARENDLYLNTQNGNVYVCTVGGDDETAKWVYNCNIAGPMAEIIDNLRTDSATKALSARQGMILNNKILDGLYPSEVDLDMSEKTYIAELNIRNVDGTIYFTTDTETVSYQYTATGIQETYNVSVLISETEGFAAEGAILKGISFSGGIHAITLKDENGENLYSIDYDVWGGVNSALSMVKPSSIITDGTQNLRAARIQKTVDGALTDLYPVTHAKATWYDKTYNQTIADKIGRGAGTANSLTFREEITEVTADMYNSISDGSFGAVHTGMHYTAPSGRTYWFAHANYNKGMGSIEQTRNTMLVIEDDITITSAHHSTNTTEGGAVASDIYTTVLPAHQGELEEDFGAEHIIPQDFYLTNAVTNGVASGSAWTSLYSSILTEKQIFGNDIRYTDGPNFFLNFLARERQLALFANMPETIVAHEAGTTNRKAYWTDTVESASTFGLANYGGYASYDGARFVFGVRRAFFIG